MMASLSINSDKYRCHHHQHHHHQHRCQPMLSTAAVVERQLLSSPSSLSLISPTISPSSSTSMRATSAKTTATPAATITTKTSTAVISWFNNNNNNNSSSSSSSSSSSCSNHNNNNSSGSGAGNKSNNTSGGGGNDKIRRRRSHAPEIFIATATAILKVIGINAKSGRNSAKQQRKEMISNDKINGQQQTLSTMPAMPKEKTSPVPLNESNFTEMKMKEQLGTSTASAQTKLIGCTTPTGKIDTVDGILSGTTPTTTTTMMMIGAGETQKTTIPDYNRSCCFNGSASTTATTMQKTNLMNSLNDSSNIIINNIEPSSEQSNHQYHYHYHHHHHQQNHHHHHQNQNHQYKYHQTNNKINYTTGMNLTTSTSSVSPTTTTTETATTTITTRTGGCGTLKNSSNSNCILRNEVPRTPSSNAPITNGLSSSTSSSTSTSSPKQAAQTITHQKPTSGSTTTTTTSGTAAKKSATDFVFGKYIGEGSFSTVYLAKDIHTNKEYAIKVCDKQHILREKKQEYVRREREVMHVMNNIPGFVHLSCTFQDYKNLYFVMTYAKNGDLLPYINKVGSFDLDCTRHYAAELVLAMEEMHKRGVIHRDLKPENILLDEKMHTLIADFGSAKILSQDKSSILLNKKDVNDSSSDESQQQQQQPMRKRKGSFVGTAQYVSPEVLQGNIVTRSADLWALGCIIYQMISGLPPFRGGNDYLIFKEIMNLNLVFPEGFDENAEDLVRNLLKLNAEERIGAQDKLGRYESIRTHQFFEGINWDTVRQQSTPPIYPYLPGISKDEELRSHYRVPDNLEPGLDDRQLTRLLGLDLGSAAGTGLEKKTEATKNKFELSESEKQKLLEAQKSDKWDAFADGEVILKKGFINKRKGLFARKRMLLLTTGPRLIYIDPVQMIKKGEIPWSSELRVEPKNFKIFFVHTPNRTYYLEDPEGYALEWVNAIEDVRQKTYGNIS